MRVHYSGTMSETRDLRNFITACWSLQRVEHPLYNTITGRFRGPWSQNFAPNKYPEHNEHEFYEHNVREAMLPMGPSSPSRVQENLLAPRPHWGRLQLAAFSKNPTPLSVLRASPLTQSRRFGPSHHDGLDLPMSTVCVRQCFPWVHLRQLIIVPELTSSY